MVIINNWKFWINAYEDLLTIEDNSDAQVSSVCGALIYPLLQREVKKKTKKKTMQNGKYCIYSKYWDTNVSEMLSYVWKTV